MKMILILDAGMTQGMKRQGPYITPEIATCSACKGTGTVYNPKDRCKRCKGNRVTEEKKALEIYIPRGAR